jgi:predicted nucleic acid-binding protein
MGPPVGFQVVDTSVLVAYMDASDPHHATAHRAMARVREEGDAVISTVTYSEILVGAFRKRSAAMVEEVLTKFPLKTWPVTDAIAVEAARIRARHNTLKLPDALIMATATVIDATACLTADARWLKAGPRVRLIQA